MTTLLVHKGSNITLKKEINISLQTQIHNEPLHWFHSNHMNYDTAEELKETNNNQSSLTPSPYP